MVDEDPRPTCSGVLRSLASVVFLESKFGVGRDPRVEFAGDGALDDVERPHSSFHLT